MGGGGSKTNNAAMNGPIVGMRGKAGEPFNLSDAAVTVVRDWDKEFQNALDLIENDEKATGYAALSSVSSDFAEQSKEMTMLIISELSLIDEQKTYLPLPGPSDSIHTVYDIHNITYRVAHGGQASQSWKELGNELRHCRNLYRCRPDGICVQLMSMYDYKGFRVLAMGKMPRIDKYVLGWDHSLKGYISDYAELHQQMMPAAETLNLKMHKLGLGELAVETFLSASTQGFTKKHVTPAGRRKLRTYITNLKDLYPTDLTKGGVYNPDEIHSEVHADSPFKLRPELIRKNHSRICADIGLAPEKPRHYLMYEHENQDQNLVEVRKICRNMMKLVTVDTMDKICKLLSTMPKDDSSETVASKCRAVCAEMQAEGMNMRLLGHMRRGISPDAAEDMQVQLRHILLHEMVARILKVSFHKVLREANGFRESETPLTEQLKKRVKGMDIDRDEDLPDMGRVGPKDPSNEACRVAICKFLNAALSRPYTPPVVPPIRNTLIEGGMDTNKVEEVLSLTRMIQEMKAYNRIHHPSGTDAALAELKKELITVVKVAIPGMTGVLENMAKRKAEEEAMRLQRELRKEELDKQLAAVILEEPLPMDPFSVYWRETIRGLIVRKYGKDTLSREEMKRDWSLLDNIDPKAVLIRVQEMTGVKLSEEGMRRLKFMADKPPDSGAVVRWVETDIISLGPRTKDMGLALQSKGWELIYKARSMTSGPARHNVLSQAQECFHTLLKESPNDWIACYDYGCSVYEQAWSGKTADRYDKLRLAYRHFRHAHQIAPPVLASMLRMGDCIYAMTVMRQDLAIEEDYVNLCVAASAKLDASQDYAARCGCWADQVMEAARMTGGYRSQRLYTLAGVTYNEWIGLGASQEAAGLAWIIQHHSELSMEPADIGVMVHLVRNTAKGGGVDRVQFDNAFITDACLKLTSNKVNQGALKIVDTHNLHNVSADVVTSVLEDHGEFVETLKMTTSSKISAMEVIKCVGLTHAQGYGALRVLCIEGMSGLKDEMLSSVAPRIPTTLTELSLAHNVTLHGSGVCDIARTHQGLLKLNLMGCERISDKSLLIVAQNCRILEEINCYGCVQVTDSFVLEMAYRTRRHFNGEEGVLSKAFMNHDDPILHLVDLVLKTNHKRKERAKIPDNDDDEDFQFDEGVGVSDDPEAMRAFEEQQRRKAVVKNMKQGEDDADMQMAIEQSGNAMEESGLLGPKKKGRRSSNAGNPLAGMTVNDLAIKLGLEDPAAREKRVRAEEMKADEKKEQEDRAIMWEGFKEGKTPYQMSRELKVDLKVCEEQKEKFDLQNKEFERFMEVKQEDLHAYSIVINISEVKIKRRVLADVSPASRLFMRVTLTTGGTVKNSGYKPVISENNFAFTSFLPRLPDLAALVKVDIMEKPDTGAPKSHGYYKSPLPKYIDYPLDYKACPLYGVSGFLVGQPVGRMMLSVRALSPKPFEEWKASIQEYDLSNLAKNQKKNKKEAVEKAQVVCDKVIERVLEWAIMFAPDSFAPYKKLRILNVAYCSLITDLAIIEIVRSMPDIRELNLAGCCLVTDKGLLYISKLCPKLETLVLDANMNITDDGMVHVASGCLGLKDVSINECRNLGDATISFIINFDVDYRLRKLAYKGMPRTTEESFSQIANACTSLCELTVSGSPMYKDVQLLHISEKCRSLVQLDLTWCEKITDLGITNMSKGCSNLTDLSLAYCEGVGSPGVTAIAENCPHIHTLDLTGLTKVKDPAIMAVMRCMLKLTNLTISLCEKLTRDSLAAINDWGEGMTSLEMLGCSSMGRKHVVRFKEQVRGRMHVSDEKDDEISAFDSLYK